MAMEFIGLECNFFYNHLYSLEIESKNRAQLAYPPKKYPFLNRIESLLLSFLRAISLLSV